MHPTLDESLRSRLEALNRGPLPPPAPQQPIVVTSIGVSTAAAAMRTPSQLKIPVVLPGAGSKAIPGLLRSGAEVETEYGQHLRVCIPIDELWRNSSQLIATRQQYLQSQLSIAQQAVKPNIALDPEFAALIAALPDRTVALDLETCGLAGSALFLIGLCRQIDGQATIELLLARNYAEEAAVLASLWRTIADCDVLLTFNGKSFDWPMVIERSVRHRLQFPDAHNGFVHIDILHHARRRWKKTLPNCRLQTLEWHVCRRHRTDDIPGHRIPAVYADFVRTGFERDMDAVLHHNALDLVTLFDLALRLAA
jgi:uncharacterized protein YprB with RNaseH-like and TPR domain